MKSKLLSLCFLFILVSGIGYAQKNKPRSIIDTNVGIRKYHNKEELDDMAKGLLLGLYIERIEKLIKLMPYIAFATKPGITMTTLGIPDNGDNRKALDNQYEATGEFLAVNSDFQRRLLPYSDTDDLVSAILFYEEIIKSLHEYGKFH